MANDDPTAVRGSVWMLAAALALVGLALWLLVRPLIDSRLPADEAAERLAAAAPTLAADGAPRPAVPLAPPPRARPVPRAAPAVADSGGATPSARDPVDAVPAADAGESGDDAGAADAPSGIALFPPPGTNPPKPGLIVPDGFALPPGYVRHYQSTDDGKQLPAILMFHPDFAWVDERGEPLVLPEDGVVPPELAPAGLPIEMLAVPETQIEVIEQPPAGADPADAAP